MTIEIKHHAHLVVGLSPHKARQFPMILFESTSAQDRERAEDLRVKLLRAELDKDEPARILILRELLTLTGGDPDKMDLAPMPVNRSARCPRHPYQPVDQGWNGSSSRECPFCTAEGAGQIAVAAMVAVLWFACSYGFMEPVSAATASLVRQAQGAAIYSDHPGKVRQGLTDYQAGLAAERDRWLRPLREIS